MNTRILMASSAFTLGAFGLLALFMPHEILNYSGVNAAGVEPMMVQIIGGLYLGFARMNWMVRSNIIGGIYSRPVVTGNVLHCTIGALALVKGALAGTGMMFLWIPGAVYSLFAVWFGLVLYTHPANRQVQ